MTAEQFENHHDEKTANDRFQKHENNEFYEKIDFNEKNDDEFFNDQYFYDLSSESPEVCKKCEIFKKKKIFNNVFYNHIRECIQTIFVKSFQFFSITNSKRNQIENRSIIKFMIFVILENGLVFRNYSYATI